MANQIGLLTLEEQVREIMDELRVDRETAALLAAVRNGVAPVDDVDIQPPTDPDGREVPGRLNRTPAARSRGD
jgi:hypothetical protein